MARIYWDSQQEERGSHYSAFDSFTCRTNYIVNIDPMQKITTLAANLIGADETNHVPIRSRGLWFGE